MLFKIPFQKDNENRIKIKKTRGFKRERSLQSARNDLAGEGLRELIGYARLKSGVVAG